MIRQLWIQPTNSLSKHEKLCRMILNWREPSAKYPTREKIILVLFNCCRRVPVRPRWTPRGPTTWGHLSCSLSKSPKPHRPWNARWQLGFRSRLLRRPSGCSLKQKLNDEFCATAPIRRSWNLHYEGNGSIREDSVTQDDYGSLFPSLPSESLVHPLITSVIRACRIWFGADKCRPIERFHRAFRASLISDDHGFTDGYG